MNSNFDELLSGRHQLLEQQLVDTKIIEENLILLLIYIETRQEDNFHSLCNNLLINQTNSDDKEFNFKFHLLKNYAEYIFQANKSPLATVTINLRTELINSAIQTKNDVIWHSRYKLLESMNSMAIGDIEIAIQNMENLIQDLESKQDHFFIIRSIFLLGKLFLRSGKNEDAVNILNNALSVSVKIKDKQAEGTALLNLGDALRFKGDYNKALSTNNQAMKIFENLGEDATIADLHNNNGINFWYLGKMEDALESYSQSYEIRKKYNVPVNIAGSLSNIAIIYAVTGDLKRAEEKFHGVVKVLTPTDNFQDLSRAYTNLGNVNRDQGKLLKAIEYYDQGLELQNTVKDQFSISLLHHNIATIFILRGEIDLANSHALQSLKARQGMGNKMLIGDSLNILGHINRSLGNIEEAKENLIESLEIAIKIDNKLFISDTLASLIEIYFDIGEIEEAKKYVDEMISLSEIDANKIIQERAEVAKGLVYFHSSSVRDKFHAADIFEKLLKTEITHYDTSIQVTLLMYELLILEFKTSEDPALLTEIHSLLDDLQETVEKQFMISLQVSIYILKSKISMLTLDHQKVKAYLLTAYEIAEDKNLKHLSFAVENERDTYLLKVQRIKQKVNDVFDVNLISTDELTKFVHDVRLGLKEQISSTSEFHYFDDDFSYCGLSRQEIFDMEKEFNLNTPSKHRCSDCKHKLVEKSVKSVLKAYVMSKQCQICQSTPNQEESVGLIDQHEISMTNFDNFDDYLKIRKPMKNGTISWHCFNETCDNPNDILVNLTEIPEF